MNPNRKMWISAGVVGAVLVGGFSVAAAASAGKTEAVNQDTEAVVQQAPAEQAGKPENPIGTQAPPTEDFIVSKEINENPGDVGAHWTRDRLEEAEPLPMPVATVLVPNED